MQFVYRIFIGLLITAISLTILSLFITSGDFLLTHNPKSMDFIAFFTGATILNHDPSQLYNFTSQQITQGKLLSNSKLVFLAFINPPFTALLFVPFLKLGLINAYDVWLMINSLLLSLFFYFSYQQIKPIKWYWALLFVLCILTFVPIPTSLLLGQLSILLSLIMLLSWIFLKNGYEFRSGLMLSLLLIKPQLLLLPFLFVLIQKRKKLLYGMICGLIFLFSISYFLVGWNGIITYASTLNAAFYGNTSYGIDLMSEHTIQTALLILFQTHSLNSIRIPWVLTIICIILPTLFIWSKKFSSTSMPTSLQFALLIITVLLTSPHTHFYDLSLLTVAAVILLSEIKKLKQKEKKFLITFLILCYCIEFFGTLFDVQTKMQTRNLWIIVDVVYLMFIWVILTKKLLKIRNKTV